MRIMLVVASAACLMAYLMLPPHGLYADDGGVRYMQMRAFQRNGWRSISIEYPGKAIDPGMQFLGLERKLIVREDQILSTYPLALPFLSSLLYPLLGDRAVHFFPLLSYLLSLFLVYKTLLLVMKKGPLLHALCLAYSIASPALLYSLTFWDHLPAVLLIWGGLHYAACYFRGPRRAYHLLLSCFFIASSIFFRSEAFVLLTAFSLALVLSLWTAKSWRHLAAAFAGIALPLCAYAALNLILYHTPLGLHPLYNAPPAPFPWLVSGVCVLFLGGLLLAYLRSRAHSAERLVLDWSFPLLWVGYLLTLLRYSPIPSLLVEFPLCLLPPFLYVLAHQGDRHTASQLEHILMGTFFAFISLMGLLLYDNPDRSVRYLLPVIPFIILYLGMQSPRFLSNRALRNLGAMLLALSFLTTMFSLPTDILNCKRYNQERAEFLAANTRAGDIVIFSSNPLFEHAAPLYFERIYFVALDLEQLDAILQRAREKGYQKAFFWTLRGEEAEDWLARRSDDYSLAGVSVFDDVHWLLEVRLNAPAQGAPLLRAPGQDTVPAWRIAHPNTTWGRSG
jgi:hypothetical protein